MLKYAVSGNLSGKVHCPLSKSELHRLILACALSEGTSVIEGCTLSADICATASVLETLGAKISFEDNSITVTGISDKNLPDSPLFCSCEESGSTLRFLVPVFAALGQNACFTGKGRLAQRPMEPLLSQLSEHGVSVSCPENGDTLPLHISGNLQGGNFYFPGNISSQYITGLLFALPLVNCSASRIILTSPLESLSYVTMTLNVLKQWGIHIFSTENGWEIPGRQHFRAPKKITAHGDWSAAAFWLCSGMMGQNPICVSGIDPDSLQGDKAVCEILSRMGGKLISWENSVTAYPSQLHGISIDGSQIPDIVPILSVAAAFAEGETHIYGAQRLRLKESDRLHAMAENLSALGAEVTELEDGLILHGGKILSGGQVSSCHDHRIAMSMAVASLCCCGEVIICDPLCVEKSYPDFYEDFKQLGGKIHVIDLGK